MKTSSPESKNPAAVALGSIKSPAKAAAARENGRKGGRPGVYRVFGMLSDEESGECWWVREGVFASSAEACAFALRAENETGRGHAVRGPGEPKPKDRPMSADESAEAWRAARAMESAE